MSGQVFGELSSDYQAHSIQLNTEMPAGPVNRDLTVPKTSTTGSLFLNKGETDDEEQS